jgi:exopolyphosphatase/pppGpp-phosphohydrolase
LDGDPPSPLSWALTAVTVGAALGGLPRMQPRQAWATGGSAHHLAGLERSGVSRRRQALRMAELEALTRQLLKRPASDLAKERKQDPHRVALLPAGAIILAAILKFYRLDRYTVLRAGVREGAILAAAHDPIGWWTDRREPETLRSA